MQAVVDFANSVRGELAKSIVGQDAVVEQVLVAILANGHVLLEGVPGVAKTLLVRSLARTLTLEFSRVQFTPDLMPSDVVGTSVFDQKNLDFKVKRGPVFTNILLADEINRTPPKTQAALLEAMEERQTTIDGESYPLPQPFMVFATQNPIEFEGTYPLPEAQQDRFLLKVLIDYPAPDVEVEVLRRHHHGFKSQNLAEVGVTAVGNAETIAELRKVVESVQVEEKIMTYIYQIVAATRRSPDIAVGGSPRAGIALLLCAKALAALRGRDFVIPDDVKSLALPVLRHRILLRPEVEIEGLSPDRVLTSLVDAQTVPR
ncbi:MAG: MoxR family ATPase [Armatimonadetes bacterium]|nr:MoxR family ATPase [Armatimonadota bacterium]